jgi:hypothetical protein
MTTPENTEVDPEPAYEGDIQMEYSSDKLFSPSTEAVTFKNLGQYRYQLIIRNNR